MITLKIVDIDINVARKQANKKNERTIMKKISILGVCLGMFIASFWSMKAEATEPNTNLIGTFDLNETKEDEDINPILILESYSINTDNIVYGNDYTLHLVFKNESKKSDVSNILVTYAASSTMPYVTPTYGNVNNFYIDEIAAESTYEMDLSICIISSKSGYVQIPFSFTYTANDQVHNTSNSYISFKISSGTGKPVTNLQDETEEYDQNTQESGPSATNQNTTGDTSSETNSSSGFDSTTIIMGVAVIVAILALFGLIFGRKKK